MTESSASSLNTLKAVILLPVHLLIYPFRLLYYANHTSWTSNPEAQHLATTLRSQLNQPCRFRLDDTSSAKLTFPDNRSLSYTQYGDLTGKPIIKLHGLPGSSLEEAYHDSPAKNLGLRIIGVDRPGVGQSSPHPSHTPRTFAADIHFLATHLQLQEFAVIGTSGGGPYVMACARYLPAENLKAIANVCGMGDIQRYRSKGMGWRNWVGYKYAIHYIPWIFPYQASHWPVNLRDLSEDEKLEICIDEITNSKLSKKDLEIWKKVESVDLLRLSLRASKEYFLRGYDTLLQDARILGSKWEFKVEEIRPDLPMHLWFGKEDENVSGYHGVEIAKRFRGEARLHYMDETHLSLQVKYRDQILEDIASEF